MKKPDLIILIAVLFIIAAVVTGIINGLGAF